MMFSVDNILRVVSDLFIPPSEMKEQEDTGGSSANKTGAKQWESGRKMGKTYGGPKYVWNSDRAMGRTYQGDPKYKWDSGASRGKANPLT